MSTHQWRVMTWQEAYPANDGSVCVRCGTTRLGWLGQPPDLTIDCDEPESECSPRD